MVPGVIAGHYGLADCRIDLSRLALRAGARFLQDSAIEADPARCEVLTAKGERLRYDILSLDVGSAPPEPPGGAENTLCVRPIEAFPAAWERLRERARSGGIHSIAVVGGGAAGIEVLLAMQHALSGSPVRFALFDAAPLLDGQGAGRRIERLLRARGVAIHAARVLRASEGGLALDGGERFQAQATVWATGANAPSWIARSGLATAADGFVAVGPTLRSTSHPDVFAAGDVASAAGGARPKSGVLAVRQGPALARNLRRAL